MRSTGFFVTIWIAAVMFKSNDILRKQTALKVCFFSFSIPSFLWRIDPNLYYYLNLLIFVSVGWEKNTCACWDHTNLHSSCIRSLLVLQEWWSFKPTGHVTPRRNTTILACHIYHHSQRSASIIILLSYYNFHESPSVSYLMHWLYLHLNGRLTSTIFHAYSISMCIHSRW